MWGLGEHAELNGYINFTWIRINADSGTTELQSLESIHIQKLK